MKTKILSHQKLHSVYKIIKFVKIYQIKIKYDCDIATNKFQIFQ